MTENTTSPKTNVNSLNSSRRLTLTPSESKVKAGYGLYTELNTYTLCVVKREGETYARRCNTSAARYASLLTSVCDPTSAADQGQH